ncbi:MAG: hypothetical protein KOO60_07350 [Gemmatimonadales bacterium]|nr:hypothetical protein [Gemmatimonadales bacterium]
MKQKAKCHKCEAEAVRTNMQEQIAWCGSEVCAEKLCQDDASDISQLCENCGGGAVYWLEQLCVYWCGDSACAKVILDQGDWNE